MSRIVFQMVKQILRCRKNEFLGLMAILTKFKKLCGILVAVFPAVQYGVRQFYKEWRFPWKHLVTKNIDKIHPTDLSMSSDTSLRPVYFIPGLNVTRIVSFVSHWLQ
jgi:hypothetical protein